MNTVHETKENGANGQETDLTAGNPYVSDGADWGPDLELLELYKYVKEFQEEVESVPLVIQTINELLQDWLYRYPDSERRVDVTNKVVLILNLVTFLAKVDPSCTFVTDHIDRNAKGSIFYAPENN